MTMNAAIVLTAEANQAKAELRAVAAETTKLKTATAAAGSEAREASGAFVAEGRALATVRSAADQASAAQVRLRTTTGLAAGSVGNLVANFNDIGMMIASGQSPLMTAIQQGTQVTQVIGPLGAAGAVRALGTAFVGMVNPVNLITIAAIAAGSAMIQWLFSSEEEVKTLDDAVGDLEASVKALGERGKVDIAGLKEDFGSVTPEVLRLNQQITELGEVRAISDLRAAIAGLKGEAEGSWWGATPFGEKSFSDAGQAADMLGVGWQEMGTSGGLLSVNPVVAEFQATLDALATARGPAEQLRLFEDLNAQFTEATGGIQQMDAAQLTYYGSIVATEQALRQMVERQKAAAEAAEVNARSVGLDDGRMGGPMAFDIVAPESNVTADLGQAQDLLATLREQASVTRLINEYGADSAQVAAARAEAERAAFVELVNSFDVADNLKQELFAAYDAANALAGVSLASIIGGWANEASRLAGNLGVAAANAWQTAVNMAQARIAAQDQLDQMAVEFSPGGQAQIKYGSRAPGGTTQQNGLETRNAPPIDTATATGSAGGATAAREESDAVAELVAKLQEEYDLLLEVDPVKKEMLRYREQLADATDAERLQVEELIRAEIELNQAREVAQTFSDVTASFLDSVIGKGQSAIQVIRNLASELLSAAANSFITGEGTMAGLLGIVGGLFQAKAEGGIIYGAGGPEDDKVPVMASPGEYMVNARATSRYRPLLEIINAGGDVPGFASGGMIGGPGAAMSGSGGRSRGPMHMTFNLAGARGNREIEELVARSIGTAFSHYDRELLPVRINEIASGGMVFG